MNYKTAVAYASTLLQKNVDNPRFEAELLLTRALTIPRSQLIAYPETLINFEAEQQFLAWVQRRQCGEPIAYILQEKEFWSLTLKVTADTLIPRSETECLVEQVLQRLPAEQFQLVADLGTGSGAIALAIAHERPHWQVDATEQSPQALQVAMSNAIRCKLTNVYFYQGVWCAPLTQHSYAAIVSNPPYIAENDPHLLQGDLRYEPKAALVAGVDGLADIRIIISQARAYLAKGGWLMLEHGYNQGMAVRKLFQTGGFKNIETLHDLAGQERITIGKNC